MAHQIIQQLSEGTWWRSDSVMYLLESSGAKDQLPGHQRLIDSPLPEFRRINPQAMNPDMSINKQSSTLLGQYFTELDYLK